MNTRPKHLPSAYNWVVEKGLVGFDPFTALQPWYFLRSEDMFCTTDTWPSGPSKVALRCFARRQDCDDIACFELQEGGGDSVVVIHGWTAEGYSILARYGSFWDWMKSVIDDIAEWSAREDKL